MIKSGIKNLEGLRKMLKSLIICVAMMAALLWLNQIVRAEDYQDVLENLGDKIQLENYETTVHADASTREGAKNITSAIFFVIDFIKYLLGSITVLMIIINAIILITAGKDSEDKTTKEKAFLKYALMGLVLVFVADEAVKLAFFGQEGEFLRDEQSAAEYATAGAQILKGIYTFVEVFMGSIAVLMLVYSGFQILVAAGSEEAVNNAKKRIYISAIGLVLVGLSETLIKDVIFKNQGAEIDVSRGREIIVGLSNFLVSTIGVISVLVFVYAGG